MVEKIIWPLAIFFVSGGWALLILLLPYNKFKESAYYQASGNGFWKTLFDKGAYGEYAIFRYIEEMPGPKRILTNLYIPREDGTTTEIDLLLITQTGIYVIESKNYSGWIFGDETYRYWTQTFGKYSKYRFYNPVWQNQAHIRALEQLLNISNKHVIKSLIVFSNRCELKKITLRTPEVKVVKRGQLSRVFKEEKRQRSILFSERNIHSLYLLLNGYTHADKTTKERHIQQVKEKIESSQV